MPQMTIADLNDCFRQNYLGLGKIVVTHLVSQMSIEQEGALMLMVRSFNAFNEDNDPHGEHDFGVVELEHESYFWKIDYYDVNYEYGSEDPSNIQTTRRVMTVMHSSEY